MRILLYTFSGVLLMATWMLLEVTSTARAKDMNEDPEMVTLLSNLKKFKAKLLSIAYIIDANKPAKIHTDAALVVGTAIFGFACSGPLGGAAAGVMAAVGRVLHEVGSGLSHGVDIYEELFETEEFKEAEKLYSRGSTGLQKLKSLTVTIFPYKLSYYDSLLADLDALYKIRDLGLEVAPKIFKDLPSLNGIFLGFTFTELMILLFIDDAQSIRNFVAENMDPILQTLETISQKTDVLKILQSNKIFDESEMAAIYKVVEIISRLYKIPVYLYSPLTSPGSKGLLYADSYQDYVDTAEYKETEKSYSRCCALLKEVNFLTEPIIPDTIDYRDACPPYQTFFNAPYAGILKGYTKHFNLPSLEKIFTGLSFADLTINLLTDEGKVLRNFIEETVDPIIESLDAVSERSPAQQPDRIFVERGMPVFSVYMTSCQY